MKMSKDKHIRDEEDPGQGACVNWCPGCCDDRAEASFRKLAPKCQTCGGSGNNPKAWGLCFGPSNCPDHACPACLGSGVVREAR